MPTTPWIFICPSSRGIGHALTRHLLRTTTLPILATTRGDPSTTKSSLLQDLLPSSSDAAARLSLVRCDVTDESSIAAAARRAEELFPPRTHHLRLACALPGILPVHPAEKHPRQVDAERSLEGFRVNTLGPLLLFKHFGEFLPRRTTAMDEPPPSPPLPAAGNTSKEHSDDGQTTTTCLPPHAIWLNMSARVGSTSDNRLGGWYTYRASKAAVNSLTRSLDVHLRARSGDRAVAVAYHPGTVRTDLSREFWNSVEEGRLFSPEYAAERLVDVVRGLELGQRGRCWDWKNDEVPP